MVCFITITITGCNEFREKLADERSDYNRTQSNRLINLCRNNEATINDVMSYRYTPNCLDEEKFAPRQYNELCRVYWCVTADGDPIDGMLTRSPKLDCSGRKQCDINGVMYSDGDILIHDCGFR